MVGNGINHLGGNSVTWEDVLRRSAAHVGKRSIMRNWNHKSFPLLYEQLFSQFVKDESKREFELKKFIAKETAKISNNDFHKKLLSTNVRNVITTNYDLGFEKSAPHKLTKCSLHHESKYSRWRRTQAEGKYIWHIHGTCDAPNTIQAGHEHYSGQLQHLRDLVTKIPREGLDDKKSVFLQGCSEFENSQIKHSWLDIFLRDEIHIIGLGLDFSEIDVWWAIAYKNRLGCREYREIKKRRGIVLDIGSTTYHVRADESESSEEIARQNILRSLNVQIKKHKGHYRGMYDSVFSLL
jgi:hypothetical protein